MTDFMFVGTRGLSRDARHYLCSATFCNSRCCDDLCAAFLLIELCVNKTDPQTNQPDALNFTVTVKQGIYYNNRLQACTTLCNTNVTLSMLRHFRILSIHILPL